MSFYRTITQISIKFYGQKPLIAILFKVMGSTLPTISKIVHQSILALHLSASLFFCAVYVPSDLPFFEIVLVPQPHQPHPTLFYQRSLPHFFISHSFSIILFLLSSSFKSCFHRGLVDFYICLCSHHPSLFMISSLAACRTSPWSSLCSLYTSSPCPSVGLSHAYSLPPVCRSCPGGASEEQGARRRGGVDQCRQRGDARGEDLGGGDGRGAEDGASCRWKFRRQLSESSAHLVEKRWLESVAACPWQFFAK